MMVCRETGSNRVCAARKATMNEFERTLLNTCVKRQMSVDALSKRAGYNPTFFKDIASGKSRRIPIDFFERINNVLGLSDKEKDALVRSWGFGLERWRWLGPVFKE